MDVRAWDGEGSSDERGHEFGDSRLVSSVYKGDGRELEFCGEPLAARWRDEARSVVEVDRP